MVLARSVGAVLSCVLLASLAAIALGATGDVQLVSRQSNSVGGLGGDRASYEPELSATGRYVAFGSNADNLSSLDDNAYENIFVRDMEAGTTTLVSRQSAVDGGDGANDNSSYASISADGRYVAFSSDADNLSGVDDNNYSNVFVRDTETETTELVSRQSAGAGGDGGDGNSFGPVISADGHYVAYTSEATNLSGADDDVARDIFVRDTQANTTTLASRKTGANGAGGDANSYLPGTLSSHGRYVAFTSDADNLSDADNDNYSDVFVRDLQNDVTTFVSHRSAADGGAGGDSDSYDPWMSTDGRYVSFNSIADNLSAIDNDNYTDVFLSDLQTGALSLVSRQSASAGGAGGDDDSKFESTVSPDGRYVAFESNADNLSGADNDNFTDIFVRDTLNATTTLVSRQSPAAGGAGGDGDSRSAALSADARYVGFRSDADNLSGADDDAYSDTFRVDFLGPPPPPPSGGPDTAPPVISHLSLSNSVFAVAAYATPRIAAIQRPKRGTRIRFSLSEPANLTIRIRRRLPGRRVHGRCVAPTTRNRSARRCTRYRRAGKLRRVGRPAGRNRIRFSGRIGTRALRRGRYVATLRAVDAAGNRSHRRSVRFRIVRRR